MLKPTNFYDVLVTRDSTESTLIRVEAADQDAAQDTALRAARTDHRHIWTPDDNMGGEPYIADPDAELEPVRPATPMPTPDQPRIVVVVADGMVASLIADRPMGAVILDYDCDQADGNGAVLVAGAMPENPAALSLIAARSAEVVTVDPAAVARVAALQPPAPAEEEAADGPSLAEWQAEVAAGDTVRGLAEWVAAKREEGLN
jgi:hypothetical protein